MKEFTSPSIHMVKLNGPLDHAQLAAMSDEELEAYLREHGYWEKKKLYRVNEEYMLREIAGECVLVPVGNLPGDRIIMMNRTCAFLWKQLQQQRTIDELVYLARQRFDDPHDELGDNVKEFIEYRVKTGHILEVK